MAYHKPLWTPERLTELRAAAVADKTVAEAAKALGLNVQQIRNAARRYNIRLAATVRRGGRPPRPPKTEAVIAAALRERWAAIIPELKANLARELRRAG